MVYGLMFVVLQACFMLATLAVWPACSNSYLVEWVSVVEPGALMRK